MCVLFAFVTAMQMYTCTTYLEVMKHVLSVSMEPRETFQSTLVRIVTAFVDSMRIIIHESVPSNKPLTRLTLPLAV